ncbi:tRNA adenosine(34) deaminase TadA [Thermobrachium celere]|uniref:tRNA adenosine(34) deaminase TadA n=1 Tax=Thermobrachium celere TaxID=53422 RepID=UPI001A4859F4|nr:tRNA adenosine(34) deaminase TadA [Thermobrachium celere]GFR36566.1 tRNA-specific adenosine deaminase [Thermobrachium celere]
MEYFMREAIKEAKKCLFIDEVPVGAVVVKDGKIVGRGHNLRETLKDATAHAEILAIKEACRNLGGWRLIDCEIYVTLEPCVMCAGALVNSRIKRLIFGAYDKRFGACGTLYNIAYDERLNHRIEVVGGVLEKECATLLSDFFRKKRGL